MVGLGLECGVRLRGVKGEEWRGQGPPWGGRHLEGETYRPWRVDLQTLEGARSTLWRERGVHLALVLRGCKACTSRWF